MKKAPKLRAEERVALNEFNTLSDKIRYLDKQGYSRADIARIVDRRYQHVRNVLVHSEKTGDGLTKTSFTLETSGLDKLNRLTGALGLSRDMYLNELLEEALSVLEGLDANAPDTEQILRDVRRPDVDYQLETGLLTRVNIALDSKVVTRANDLCKAKLVPRDILVDELIEFANKYLSQAQELIANPFQAAAIDEYQLFSECVLSQDKARILEQRLQDEFALIGAVAEIKRTSFESARAAYQRLTHQEKEKLRQNPDVLDALSRHAAQEFESVSLDDLLPKS